MKSAVSRRLGRLFYCLAPLALLLGAGPGAHASEPAKTLISEGLFGARAGNEKKEAALSFVSAAISMSEALARKDIVDEGKFNEGLGKVIDGVVQCLNASAWAKGK